ncbi:MAG TPA: alpha/beta hydrolase [Anaerolineae bacterium]|nr:alpha/beta hydrolase [Anaerolineae bacterium]
MPTIDIAEQSIFYTDKGSGDALLILADHLHSSHAYTREIDHFAERFRVVSFDYPGTGQSTRGVKYLDEYQVDLWGFRADLACHLLMALDIGACSVLGTGGGALGALHFAGKQARQHELMTRWVIADSFLADLDGRTLHRTLDVREHYYMRRGRWLEEQHGEDWRQVVDWDTAFLREVADRGGYKVPDFVLKSIACPVLLTGHLQDPIRPGIAQEYARISGLVPDCTIYLDSSAGHPHIEQPFMWSNPARFFQIVDLFLTVGTEQV